MTELYLEAGVVGVVVVLFSYMVMTIIKSLKVQNEDIDELRQAIHKMEAVIDNSQSIVLKLVDRINAKDKSDEIRSEKEEASKGKALGRFGERIERLERIIIRMEGRILNGYKE
jgi:cell division protein FtsL